MEEQIDKIDNSTYIKKWNKEAIWKKDETEKKEENKQKTEN